MSRFIDELLSGGPIVTDGAWGTQLQARGLEVGECPDSWNLLHPERVAEVARAYVQAGSQVILTNTFGSNRLILERSGLGEHVAEINRIGAEVSKRAAGAEALVFASMGPSGKMLLAEEVTEEELLKAFVEQATALAEGGADAIVIETMSELTEARLAVQAAKGTGLSVVACMVYDCGSKKDRTMTGVTPEEAAKALTEAGADVIGANCGQGIEGFVSICARLRAATPLPLWIKPNAGLPEMVGDKAVYRTTPEEFAGTVPALLEAGARFIGGCCGTDPNFIRAIQGALARSPAIRE